MDNRMANCEYRQDGDEDSTTYMTDCGEGFSTNGETDLGDWIKYCFYCGGKVTVVPYAEWAEDD